MSQTSNSSVALRVAHQNSPPFVALHANNVEQKGSRSSNVYLGPPPPWADGKHPWNPAKAAGDACACRTHPAQLQAAAQQLTPTARQSLTAFTPCFPFLSL